MYNAKVTHLSIAFGNPSLEDFFVCPCVALKISLQCELRANNKSVGVPAR